jgi:dUTP pyrophosphatase
MVIYPGGRATIPTGLAFAIPLGHEGQVRSRSGLMSKHGVCVGMGTCDADYRGQVHVLLFNHGADPFTVNPLDRIAQIVFARHDVADLVEVDELDETERGANGFGSTGQR